MNNEEIQKNLIDGFQTASLNWAYQSNLAYRPEFLSNDYRRGRKVLVSIEQELANCEDFKISVAFITKSGITPLLQVLKELESKDIPGKILTTDYLGFSEPEALEKLAALKNIELRMFKSNNETGGFHTKGYLFRSGEIYRIIIGSSNMTLSAVTKNREWNAKIVTTEEGEIAKEILGEFNSLWDDEHTQAFGDFIEEYKLSYVREKIIREQQREALKDKIVYLDRYKLKPNKMQVAFLANLQKLQLEKSNKALLLSATGTGKTFASAFAVREMKPEKMLFVVHREQIAKQAINSYRRVFGDSIKYGLLSGNSRETDANYLFSTMQMMAKPEILNSFKPDEFDVIILDECHHAGAESYQRIINYYKPKFWLGMTGSPDTNQYDIYSIFDHNIAYEIRLQQALEEDLLCPFHYFGITDLEINGEVFDDESGVRNFNNLVSDARVKYVLEKAQYYGYSGDRVKGLIFCSRKDEARELSNKFNKSYKPNGKLYRTTVLTGEDSQEAREYAIWQLTECNDEEKQLDYIFTVDIFNEGVDIPEVNQVIMLRPTESPVVFVQQLGRGLRKIDGKEYVVILDFIGNYMNNFMIPIALSGDRSYNKDSMRKYVMEGSRIIPGSSTIHFDEVSKKRIYESIDKAKTNEIKLLKESYQNLKFKLGRIPCVTDFKKFGSIDVTKFFTKCGSYYAFLKKYEPEYQISYGHDEEMLVEYFSSKLASYKRIQEAALLKALIIDGVQSVNLQGLMSDAYKTDTPVLLQESVYHNLTNTFPEEGERNRYVNCVLIEQVSEGEYKLTDSIKNSLENDQLKEDISELILFAIDRFNDNYSIRYKDTNLQLYQKYTYEDVCRLLNWESNLNGGAIGGYKYDEHTKTLPVFINYEKAEGAISYRDRFVSENKLIALSKTRRNIYSKDVLHIYKRGEEEKNNRIFLFIRKNRDDNETKEFYFLGEIFAEGGPKPVKMEQSNVEALEFSYRLDVPVRSDIYDYIIEG